MRIAERYELPDELKPVMRRAVILEWASIGYLSSVTVLMFLVMGSSQAMKAAWVEDMLSLVPPIVFLISAWIRKWPPNPRYPYGYHRVVSIAFLLASFALLAMGLYLLFDSSMKLIRADHPTIGSVTWFGPPVWLGWLMLPVLVYSVVPAVILGYLKKDPARKLHDKTLFADSQMNKADWMTGLAAALGVIGIGLGFWWADSVAAAIISLDVTRDGWRNMRAVVADLMDRQPYEVDHKEPIELPRLLERRLRALPWVRDAAVRLRENGHVFFGEVYVLPRDDDESIQRSQEAQRVCHEADWRVHDVAVEFVPKLGAETSPAG